ncbi:MAG: RNB domain-containing ribonuclease [Rugosibacter sp.]|nr:RNB domain-containing ribonuclease [Rugosibacter sp.]
MNVLYEEDGAFRAGAVLADNVSSLQVTLPTGRRVKVKAAHVLLRFETPSAAVLLAEAEVAAEDIEVDFLWEVGPAAEFGFTELAAEYFGQNPTSAQAAAVLLRLHSAPMYFHRKGRGRYFKAPPEILQAALAGMEKKRLQAEAITRMAAELVAGRLPDEFKSQLPQLLYAADRNRPEAKAMAEAAAQSGKSEAQLLLASGAVASAHDYHLGRFLHECFREGTGFAPYAPVDAAAMPSINDLPLANLGTSGYTGGDTSGDTSVRAFSIDDAATTEIDDAFSVAPRVEGGWRIGVHIAAPGLGFAVDSDLGQIARRRLSTVYMPGQKITMLPEAVVDQFTLAAGRTAPAISLYLEVAADLRLLSHSTQLDRITIADNLRHHDIEPLFNAATLTEPLADFPYRDELTVLWEFSQVLAAGRGQQDKADSGGRKDYNFVVDWDANVGKDVDGPGQVSITERPRGSPLDTLVAELMIFANATWGAALRDAGIPALYRVQTGGKVRMSTVAAAHEGLGVDCYAWSSSPLRRYADLVNQWQLIAWLRNEPPSFAPQSTELFTALRDFELTYATYAEFQRHMERYWCLRYLAQTETRTLEAVVIKESLARVMDLPLVLRVASLPDLAVAPRGARVRLAVEGIDLLSTEIRVRFVELLAGEMVAEVAGVDDADSGDLDTAATADVAGEIPAGASLSADEDADTAR